MAELTVEQKRALAMAAARKRKAESEAAPDPYGDLPYPGNPNFLPEDQKWVTPGKGGIPIISDFTRSLYPFEQNTQTGELRPAIPKIIPQTIEAVKDAVTLPADVMQGKVDPMSDEGIGRTFGAATIILPGAKFPAGVGAKVAGALKTKAGADTFDIPLTKGQTTGDLAALTKEEALRQTSGNAQNVMRVFDEVQRGKIADAAEGIGNRVGRNPETMPETVATAVKDKVAFSKQQAGAFYDIAKDGQLVVAREALDELPGFVQMKLANDAVIVDASITPSAMQALKEIEAAGKLQGGVRPAAPATGATADEVVGVSLEGLEQVRKRLVGLKGSTPEDMRAVAAIKRGFDEWLDAGVDQMLISGDDAALDALKKARASTVEYKKIDSPKPGDAVGATVGKFLDEETTAQEVGYYLYGSDIVSPSLNAPKVAARIRSIVGADSEAWQSVKAAAWDRIVKDLNTGDVRSATMVAKRIEGFVNNKGSSLARIMFTEQERQMMLDFAAVLKKTVTPRDATNPSRSAFTFANMMNTMARVGSAFAGFQMGDYSGAIAGALVYPVFRDTLRTNAAKSAVKGYTPKPDALPIGSNAAGAAVKGGSLIENGGQGTGETISW